MVWLKSSVNTPEQSGAPRLPPELSTPDRRVGEATHLKPPWYRIAWGAKPYDISPLRWLICLGQLIQKGRGLEMLAVSRAWIDGVLPRLFTLAVQSERAVTRGSAAHIGKLPGARS